MNVKLFCNIPISAAGRGTIDNSTEVEGTTNKFVTAEVRDMFPPITKGMTYPTPGKSFVRPPLTNTTLCS